MSSQVPPKETLPHLIRRALEEPRDAALLERVNGTWAPTSSQRLLERVQNVACAIRDAGLQQGDRVSLIARDSVDWIVCDFATFFAGCVVVPIFPTQALDHTAHILEHSDTKLLFVDSETTQRRLIDGAFPLPPTIVFESTSENSLANFEKSGAEVRVAHPELPAAYEASLQPDDLAVLIYTSGTTGNPKGVMLSHDNLVFDSQSALNYGLGNIEPEEHVLSVLPFSHIYEHTMIYIYLLAKVRYAICHDPAELLHDLQELHPVSMTAVPRIFDRVLHGITGKALQHGGLQAKLVPWALTVGREYMTAKTFGHGAGPMLSLQYAIAKRLVLDKVRNTLGLDKLEFFTSGSAALHPDVAMTYLGLGLPIMQGYGLTESSPVITVSRMDANEYGAVGKPIPGVELRIATDGEVLARGRNIMHGYYLEPEATASALEDGWLHTGDIGEIDAQGYLRITDRKKEVFKTATGKFVSPARVESAIKRSHFVAQAMVIGDGRPHPVALITPNWDLVRVELDIPAGVSAEELAKRSDVVDFMTAKVREQTADLAKYEQIRVIALLPREFSVESGELSPSFKIKRRVVEQRYRPQIEALYAENIQAQAS